jgi:renalase
MEKIANFKKIASIGCGVSNLSFLYSFLPDDKIRIDLFEKESKISGRASTRSNNGYTYDLGANYISSSSETITELLTNKLKNDNLITIDKWLYPFDKFNNILFDKSEETVHHNRMKKFNYKTGINTIGDLLLKDSKANHRIHFDTQVAKISKVGKGKDEWELFSNDNKSLGIYDHVVFGIPIPQLINILKNSNIESDKSFPLTKAIEELSEVEYKVIYTLAVAFEPKINFDFYALINSDREHDISWVSLESEKKGRIAEEKENSSLFIVQMSDKFSSKCCNSNLTNDDINSSIIEKLKSLLPQLNQNNSKVSFTDSKLWKYALPKNKISQELVDKFREKNIFIIGDCLWGKGRVDGAILTGIELHEYFRNNILI